MSTFHGTCVSVGGRGVLLLGPAGAGKSDLAARLVEAGAFVVADDQVILETREGALWASCPPPLHGLIELRGFGIVPVPCVEAAPVVLAVSLRPGAVIEHLPEPAFLTVAGHKVRLMTLDPFTASASAKVRLAVAAVAEDSKSRVQPGLG